MQREALFRKLNWHRWALPSLGLHSGVHLLGQGLAASVTLGQVSLAWPAAAHTRRGLSGPQASHERPRQSFRGAVTPASHHW